ncbi:MAG TPA: hypothetical protein PLD91_15365 [Spirochaetota bacterium]|nr:hypothetical protein [Spirochaetota bacterium]
MNKLIIGLVVGIFAGVIDVIPMIPQKLTWDANISAFSMWVIVGVFIATTEYKIASGFKGIIIAFLVLCPSAILIGWKEPISLVPISLMTIILGTLSGIIIEMIKRKHGQ